MSVFNSFLWKLVLRPGESKPKAGTHLPKPAANIFNAYWRFMLLYAVNEALNLQKLFIYLKEFEADYFMKLENETVYVPFQMFT